MSQLERPRVLVVVGHVDLFRGGDDVVVDGQDGLRVRLDPRHLAEGNEMKCGAKLS